MSNYSLKNFFLNILLDHQDYLNMTLLFLENGTKFSKSDEK